MKNTRRSAFTIVELVIVIAVIAILSAVLIPTFGAIIKDANEAADNAAAATLTSELHVWLKGETIDSEEELMAALASKENGGSGIGEKLVPKALAYGYHFWFDMENQMIVAGYVEDIEKIGKEETPTEQTEGIALASAALTADVSGESSFGGLRNLFPHNDYYLITAESALGNIFGDMSGITKDTYDDFIANLNTATGHEVFGKIATYVFDNFKNTVVVNDNGVFFYADASNAAVYFAPGIKTISAKQYVFDGTNVNSATAGNLPVPAGNIVNLPSSVILVEEGSLNFATANSVKVNTSCANYTALSRVLTPNCSNSIFVTKDGIEHIVQENRLYAYATDGNHVYECDLIKRVPFATYTVGSATTTDLIEWGGNEEDILTLYVAITQSGKATLYMEDTVSREKSYATVNSWTSDNNQISISAAGVLTFDPTTLTDYTASITAETYNINGESKPIKFNVEVVKPTSANVTIDGIPYALNTDGSTDAKTVTIDYISADTEYEIALSGNIGYSNMDYKLGSGKITVTTGDNSVLVMGENGKAKLDLSKTDYTFSISIDGCLTTNFEINVIDFEKAAFENNFHYDKHQARPYYVGGKDSVPLSALFTLKEDMDYETATVTIYDRTEGKTFAHINEVNNTTNGIAATYNPETFTKDEWEDQEIKFTANRDYYKNPEVPGIENTVVFNVWVEIVTDNNYATYVQLIIAENAINVVGTDFASISGTATSDIVLHGDVSSVANTTKIDLGEHTLYGNGYKINATSYTSIGTNDDEKYLNDQFISVSGGTIDNVYINGPIYPELDYNTTKHGYHVSGIEVTGDSTIKNSYVSGFRQPICVNDAKLTLNNTTLYGGNYANLQLIKGSIEITDVTTVQPNAGIPDTFNEEGKKHNVIGLGIVVEKDAIANGAKSAITIKDGYLDQYNWVSADTQAYLPTFEIDGTKIDMKVVLAAMFNGIRMNINIPIIGTKTVDVDLGFLEKYLEIKNNTKYLNTGIMFLAIAPTEDGIAANSYGALGNISVNDDERKASDYAGNVGFEPQVLPLFSKYNAVDETFGEGKWYETTVQISADKLTRELDKFEVDATTKKATSNFSLSTMINMLYPIDVCMEVWSYPAPEVELGTTHPINWTQGYYINYGVTTTD